MSPIEKLQWIGFGAAFITLTVAYACAVAWGRLPDNKKVWAMFAFIMWCGVLEIISEVVKLVANG